MGVLSPNSTATESDRGKQVRIGKCGGISSTTQPSKKSKTKTKTLKSTKTDCSLGQVSRRMTNEEIINSDAFI